MAGSTEEEVEYANTAIDPQAALRSHETGLLRSLGVCYAACVVGFDEDSENKQIVKVLPLVKVGRYYGEWKYSRREPIKVTVLQVQQGGLAVHQPLFIGDTGWVVSSDRDTMLLKQKDAYTSTVLEKDRGQEGVAKVYPQKPNSTALHDLSMGFFIPDSWGAWEMGRWKDGLNIHLNTALYLGQSIDTEDGDQLDDGTEDETASRNKVKPQKGDRYEKEISSSLVLERHGGIHLLSSSPKEEMKTSRLSAKKNTIEAEVLDNKEEISRLFVMGLEEGILHRMESKKDHFSFHNSQGATSFKSVQGGKNIISINMVEGEISMMATGDVDLKSKETMNIDAEGNVHVVCDAAKMEVEEDVTMRSEGSVSVLVKGEGSMGAGGTVHLESATNMLITAAKDISIKCKELSVETVEGFTLSSLGDEEGGKVLLKSGEKIEMNAKYREVKPEGKDKVGYDPIIHWVGFRDSGDANLSVAEGGITIRNTTNAYVDLEGGRLVYRCAEGNVRIGGQSVTLDGERELKLSVNNEDNDVVKMSGFSKQTIPIKNKETGKVVEKWVIWSP